MPGPELLTPLERRARNIGLGCLMTVLGFFSMAMVGVLVSAVVAGATRTARCPDIPACNWYIYALVGGVFGSVSLPILVLRRLNRPSAGTSGQTPKP